MKDIVNFFKDEENFEYVIYIIGGLIIVCLILAICSLVQDIKLGSIKKKYKKFMQGQDGKNLEEVLNQAIEKTEENKELISKIEKNIETMQTNLLTCVQKVGVVKYNAFKDMGGNMSFVVTLLDANNNGITLNAMHTREGCYTYVKQVENGQISIQISDDEKKSLEEALSK